MDASEYVDVVLQTIHANLRPQEGLITAARLGYVLRRDHPEVSWQRFGYPSLKSFLEYLQTQALVTICHTEKEALAVAPTEQVPAATAPRLNRSLRRPFWIAFVLETPPGRRFIHRPSGTVRMAESEEPSPPSEWVEVEPIPQETQREWALEFVRTHCPNELAAVESIIQEEDWYLKVPEVLDQEQKRQLNRHRSGHVASYVESWCRRNGIDPSFAFEQPQQKHAAPMAVPRTGEPIRDQVLRALAKMPTHELLELPIPLKYVLAVKEPC
jgi:hypothetical protein